MKKIMPLLLLLLTAEPAFAQLYIAPSYSYALPVLRQEIVTDYIADPNGTMCNVMYGSFGGGSSVGGTFGYQFPNGFVVAMDGEWFGSNRVTEEFRDSTSPSFNVVCRREAVLKGHRFVPKIGYAISRNKFTFTVTNGVIFSTGLLFNMRYTEQSDSWSVYKEENHSGKAAWGFRSALAMRYHFGKVLYASLELFGDFQSWRPEKGELVQYEVNGTDQLPSASYPARYFVFEENFVSNPANTSGPSKRLAKAYSMSDAGARFSVGIEFGRGTK